MSLSHWIVSHLLKLGSYVWHRTSNLRQKSAALLPAQQELFDWTFVFLGNIRYTLDARAQLPKYGIPDIAQVDGAIQKRSDTLFVFGSGPTINDLSATDFEFIRNHDSLGFNYFLVHDFVPDFYCYETPLLRDWYSFFCELLNAKSQYEHIPLIIQFPHFETAGFDIGDIQPERRPTYFLVPYRYKTTNESRLRLLLRLRRWFAIIRPFNIGSVIHHGGSISYIVSLAHALGYKRIVLLGVDMFSDEYFFTVKPNNPHKQELFELIEAARAGQPVELHANPNRTSRFGELPPDVFLRLFNEIFLAPDGVALLVGSPKSRLASFLPVFAFPDAA